MAEVTRLVHGSGQCEIDLGRRELRVLGNPVPVGGRAFEFLEVLAASAGELVTKDALMDRIWPGAAVLDNTLQVHATAIRKALGPCRDLLKTESGRGYRLLGDWSVHRYDVAPSILGNRKGPTTDGTLKGNIPMSVAPLVGRTAVVQRLENLVSAYRVVTLVGPGGIGKSALAAVLARRILGRFPDGGWVVELASLVEPNLVPSMVGRVLGLYLDTQSDSLQALARAIGERRILLLLDNCEHVIEAVASQVEVIVAMCPGATILTTSREVLRIQGEQVFRVPPLDVPGEGHSESDQLIRNSAVELFITRIREHSSQLSTDATNLRNIGAICRRLDGIPLAIEFAAAHAATIGVDEVLSRLDDRFALLTAGRRTALPKHRTLRATLDWSYRLLNAEEREVLKHLAIFVGGFSLHAAHAVASENIRSWSDTVRCLDLLVAKSLVVSDLTGLRARFRLLETTRAYALDKLSADGGLQQVPRRHADYYCQLLHRVEGEIAQRPSDEWLDEYTVELGNVHAAIDWAFSPVGSQSLGVALTAAAIPLWTRLSMLKYREPLTRRALAAIAEAGDATPHYEMKLLVALGASLIYASGGGVSEIEAVGARALHLAETLRDVDYQLRALYVVWLVRRRGAVGIARRFSARAISPDDQLVGEQMMGISYHYRGQQEKARYHFDKAMVYDARQDSGRRSVRFLVTQTAPLSFYARTLWAQGQHDQAIRIAANAVEQARNLGHIHSLCQALARAACPITLWIADSNRAEYYTDLLLDHSATHGLTLWHAFGTAYLGMLLLQREEIPRGIQLLFGALKEFAATSASSRALTFHGELAMALGRSGRISEGLAMISDAITLCKRSMEYWTIPELFRIKGVLLSLLANPVRSWI